MNALNAIPEGLKKAFVTLESTEGRYSIVMKFNQSADAFAVHGYLLGAGGKEYNGSQQGGGELPQDERALAERSADLFGVAYLVNGKYVPPEFVKVVIRDQRAASVPAQAVQQPVAGQENPQAATYPDQIWLQSGEPSNDDVLPYTDGLELTWCADRQHRTDVLYVRADIAEEANRRAEQLAADWGISQIEIAELRGRLNASAVPAASVQPESVEADQLIELAGALEVEKVRHVIAQLRAIRFREGPFQAGYETAIDELEVRLGFTETKQAELIDQQPDIGRDAALDNESLFDAIIALQPESSRHIDKKGHDAACIAAADIVLSRSPATQVAPEVASVPDDSELLAAATPQPGTPA